MFGSLGGPELLVIFVIALIVFGPRKLPEIGKSLGKMIAEFRKASNDLKRTIEDEVEADRLRELSSVSSGDLNFSPAHPAPAEAPASPETGPSSTVPSAAEAPAAASLPADAGAAPPAPADTLPHKLP
jgi:TatA/E family protein of Tat protein translocase